MKFINPFKASKLISQLRANVQTLQNVPILQSVSVGRYVALVGLDGQNNPVAEVLENTLGVNITWSRQSTGVYVITASSPVFTAFKTTILSMQSATLGATYPVVLIGGRTDNTTAYLLTLKTDATGTPYDGLGLTTVQIEVYE